METQKLGNASRPLNGFSRRDLLQKGGALAALMGASGGAPGSVAEAATSAAGSNPYEAIGVRPLVNCRGTFTIISGSL
jgi:L-seryl-tRNA(Ser) seleniumtransferase